MKIKHTITHFFFFFKYLLRTQLISSKLKTMCLQLYGNYLVLTYLIVKLVYMGNVVGQIVMMNKFLGTDYHMYGFRVLQQMVRGESWSTSDRFPRITLCDIQIRRLGNIHNYTIQCSLPLNLFNEKIYIFVWFWFAIVALATACSFIQWVWLSVFLPSQIKYIYNRLIALNALQDNDDFKSVNNFVRMYLKRDGLFIIRMVAKNSSDLIAAELICGLFEHFKDNFHIIEKLNKRDTYRLRKKEMKHMLKQQLTRQDTHVEEIT